MEENVVCEIRLQKFSFRYPGAGSNTLKKIDLTIHAGERPAVVGLDRAGKTTMVKLICGFLEPTEGVILLNGVNIKNLTEEITIASFPQFFRIFLCLT